MLWDRFKKGFDAWEQTTAAKLEKALGQPTTFRNVTTVAKLAAKYGPASS